MTQLSICMPSNRDLQASRMAIETALTYAEKADCLLIVSDNSRDPAKRAFLENRSPRLIYLVPETDNALFNMTTALSAATTPFVLPMGDDDEIYLLDDAPRLDLKTLSADVVGVRLQTYIWTNERGVHRVERFPIECDDAGERLLEYNGKARGNNSLYYSIYRTEIYRGLFKLFAQAHPTQGGYCDWAMSFAFIAGGKFLYDAATIYRYDLGSWSGETRLEASKAQLFEWAGLPPEAETYSMLLRFVDGHGFLMWNGLAISGEQRQNAITVNARLALGTFLKQVETTPHSFPEDVRYLADLIRETRDITEAFQIALLILDRLQPGLSARYATFYNAAVGIAPARTVPVV